MTTADLAKVIAAPAGTTVKVESKVESDGVEIIVSAHNGNQKFDLLRTFSKDSKGDLVVHHDFFDSGKLPKGTGARVLAKEVAEYRKIGVKRIETYAAGYPRPGSYFNGFITWPKLGFSMDIPVGLRSQLENDGFTAKNIHELFLEYGEAGIQWWEKNGSAGDMVFDVEPNSVSSLRLSLYLEDRKVKL